MSNLITSDIFKKRQSKLSLVLKESDLDGVALNPGPSLTYFTGLHFHLSERPVVVFFTPSGAPTLVLPEFESRKVENLDYELQTVTYTEDIKTWAAAFKQASQAAGLQAAKLGVEDRAFRLLELRLLESAMPNAEFINAVDTIGKMRMYKDPAETSAMQAAADTAQNALEAILPNIKAGVTELEIASELIIQLLKLGSGELPFQPIISTGPNSANPHANPSQRILAEGDLLIIDWGAGVEGYFSDITRTFGIGEVEEEFSQIYQIVKDANAAARAAAAPGVTCGDVDKAAREVIEAAGYGEYFTHRTGHGLGMEVHEEPYMRAGNSMLLEPGMTFTIEPGIYIPDRGGVRIEDDMLITPDGAKSFTSLPREFRQLG